jgi:hypothetical protein
MQVSFASSIFNHCNLANRAAAERMDCQRPVAQVSVPENFIDCISCTFFKDPVITADGHTYERSWIEAWLARGNTSSPLTNLPLAHTTLTPNIALRNAIEEFLTQHPEIDREGFKMEKGTKNTGVSWTQFFIGTAVFAVGYLLGGWKKSKDAEKGKDKGNEGQGAAALHVMQTGFGSS